MKRRLAFLLALTCMFCAAPAMAAENEMHTTVLVYMSGSDLESEDASATADIQEMLRANVPADGALTVLVETGGAKRWHLDGSRSRKNRLYRIVGDSWQLLETVGRRNMGDPDTLSDFLAYARESFPAERYVLVLWGHGDGPTGGVCFDELFADDALMLNEIAAALEGATRAGQSIDALIFDACMMNSADLLFSLGAYADYIVASQESTLGSGGRYDLWLSALVENPEMDGLEICTRFADDYVATGSHGLFSQTTTASVLDCGATDALQGAVEALYGELNRRFDDSADEICAAVADLASFGELDGNLPSGLMDALHLCDALEPFAPEACAALRAAVEHAVSFRADSGALEDATCGLSLFLPCAAQDWPDELYDWYQPLADDSSYAQLIVRMAREQEQREAQGGSLLDALRDALSGDSESDAPSVDAQHIWQGLEPNSDPTANVETVHSARPDAPAVDMYHIWQGLEPAAGDEGAPNRPRPGSPAVDMYHIWQGLEPAA